SAKTAAIGLDGARDASAMSLPSPSTPHPAHSVGPHPVADLGWILQIVVGEGYRLVDPCVTVRDQLWCALTQARHTTNRLRCQVEAAHLIQDDHLEWGRGGALLVVAAHMNAIDIGMSMHDLVNRPLIAVKGKNHGLV